MKCNPISKLLGRAADKVEAAAGSPIGIAAFLAWCVFVPRLSVDVANYGISVYTAGLLVFSIPASRRDRKALHAKVDDLEEAIETANSANARLEELSEQEIEARRTNRA